MFRNKCKGLLRVSLSMAMAMAATSSLSVGFPDLTAPAMAAQYRKADVDAEIARLHSDSSQTRKVAAFHLSEMGIDAKPAIPELLVALHDPVAFGEAAAALGKIGPDAREAVPSLITCLGDTSLVTTVAMRPPPWAASDRALSWRFRPCKRWWPPTTTLLSEGFQQWRWETLPARQKKL